MLFFVLKVVFLWGCTGFDGENEFLWACSGWSPGLIKRRPKTNRRILWLRHGRLIFGLRDHWGRSRPRNRMRANMLGGHVNFASRVSRGNLKNLPRFVSFTKLNGLATGR